MKLLLTSIGKRVQLVEHLKSKFTVIGVDASEDNAARDFVDKFYVIHKCDDLLYKSDLMKICEEEKIDLMIPLYEKEFPILNELRPVLDKIGVKLLLSSQEVIDICSDKFKTAFFFNKYKIKAPFTYSKDEKKVQFPVIIKPFDGMGSQGVFKATKQKELKFFVDYVENPIVQECVIGTEYTIDVLCDFNGKPIYIIPRERLEVRSGEVVKSRTIGYQTKVGSLIINHTKDLLENLNQEGKVVGPITVQCFVDSKNADKYDIKFIEINARFGGGVPLAFEAGADYAGCLKEMCEGEIVNSQIGFYKRLTMLRYDTAIYRESEDK